VLLTAAFDYVAISHVSRRTNEVSEWENVIKTMFYIIRLRESGHSIVPSLVVSVGSVFACHLVVGPSVELLCWSTPGPGISIHPHQHDLTKQEERRTGNVRHCRRRRGNQTNSGKDQLASRGDTWSGLHDGAQLNDV
jgi:hypothetical protein